MKVVFIGGGSHRYLSVARSILADNELMKDGEINVYDLDLVRAENMAKMIRKCPEYKDRNCVISWGTTLDEALKDADVVNVVLMAGSRESFEKSRLACKKYGFIDSDQLSPSGAFLALKGGPILMNIARKMEKICPDAFLLDFANPVAVLSAAVNNHTKIRCLGVCAGYTNHTWDISRMLGKDEHNADAVIDCVGVNHCGFILKGSTWKGKDLYSLLDKHITEDWKCPTLSERWNEISRKRIEKGMYHLVGLYRKYGYMIFSSEGDGMDHLDFENRYFAKSEEQNKKTAGEIDTEQAKWKEIRKNDEIQFKKYIDQDLSEDYWNEERADSLYLLRADENIMVKIIKALGGVNEMRIATSYPNNGAVTGIEDRIVLEYSQIIDKDGIRPAGSYKIPSMFYGLIASLASHQTLLGDAIATEDPRKLFEALYAYPVKQDTADSKAMWLEQLEINKDEIPAPFQETKKWLKL